MRIVSLLPSATEILCHIGGRGMLVGRSHECDYPPGIEGVPVLTGARIPSGAGAAEVDRLVREQLETGGSLYTLDSERLRELRPDVILTQDLCRVCSIDLGTVRKVAEGLGARIVSLDPHGVEDVLDDVLKVGREAGLEEEATAAVVGLRERLWRAADFVNPYLDGPEVAFLEWTEPLFVGGHWTPQLIERAGGRHSLNPTVAQGDSGAAAGPQAWARRAGASVRVSEEQLIAARPERIVISPCGVGLEKAKEMARALTRKQWWGELPAVERGAVAVVDGNQMFNRPGPRLVDAFEWLVGWINDRPMPTEFPWEAFGG